MNETNLASLESPQNKNKNAAQAKEERLLESAEQLDRCLVANDRLPVCVCACMHALGTGLDWTQTLIERERERRAPVGVYACTIHWTGLDTHTRSMRERETTACRCLGMHACMHALDWTQTPPPPLLKALAEELGPLYAQGKLDGFNLYVYGMVLKALRPRLVLGAGGSGSSSVEGRPRSVGVPCPSSVCLCVDGPAASSFAGNSVIKPVHLSISARPRPFPLIFPAL